MKPIRQEFVYGQQKVTLETGRIAKQATGAVLVTMDNTVVLCTVVANRHEPQTPASFFPLTVNYQEKTYATGKIPGSFFRREGRPSEQEVLNSRLIDRSIRPLFAKGFMQPVQVVCTVMSADNETVPDIPALMGTAAALSLSGLPFNGPLMAARVSFQNNLYVLNPTYSGLQESPLDMVVAGTKDAVLMVESEADQLSEDMMLGAILFAQQEMQVALNAIDALTEEAGQPKWEHQEPKMDQRLLELVQQDYGDQISKACSIHDKSERSAALSKIKAEIAAMPREERPLSNNIFDYLHKQAVRKRILDQEPRLDGRDNKTVRPIDIEVGLLPKTHGSALFTRGETQSIVTATMGPLKDAALIDALTGTYREPFLLHYNFPPYSVGETGFMGSPKRREVGHGNLARRAIIKMLPESKDYPFTIRVVSEITESNGSSSMATVCGASLSLMDAGIPLKAAVAGVAMGLVLDGGRFAVLTDIMGDEDHLGDMDFKVAGTSQGITALQMDIKVTGITTEIMEQALEQANAGRMHILEKMNEVLAESRSSLSDNAPAFKTIQIKVNKIRELIGKGGATIRALTEETGATIDINDDGSIKIYADTGIMLQDAITRIEMITSDPEPGVQYQGIVKSIVDFGAFVELQPSKRQGLLHVSEIVHGRVENVSDYLSEGQEIEVMLLSVDRQGRMKLSMKALDEVKQNNHGDPSELTGVETAENEPAIPAPAIPAPAIEVKLPAINTIHDGIVKSVKDYGGFIEISPGVEGLLHISEMTDKQIDDATTQLEVGQKVRVMVISTQAGRDKQDRPRIGLSINRLHEIAEDNLKEKPS